jgi:hypothetical protein
MRLKSTHLTPTGFGNGLWGAASRRVVRNAFSVAAIFAITVLGPTRMTSVAWADEDPSDLGSVRSVTISVLGWDFTPIIQNGVIKGIFGQITSDIAVEGNLETVWFEQDESGDWIASSWYGSGTAPNALGWIRGHFADLEIFAINPSLDAQAPEPVIDEETLLVLDGDWLAPTAIDGGLLADDPLQLWMGDGPRTPEMFAMLALNGWPVAPELSPLCSHHGGDCEASSEEITLQQLLDALTVRTLLYMPGTTKMVGEIDAMGTMPVAWCACEHLKGQVIPNSCANVWVPWRKDPMAIPDWEMEYRLKCKFAWQDVGQKVSCFSCALRSTDPGQLPEDGYRYQRGWQGQAPPLP